MLWWSYGLQIGKTGTAATRPDRTKPQNNLGPYLIEVRGHSTMSEHKDNSTKPAEDIVDDLPSLKPNLPDLYEPSAARALKALGVELRYNLRSQRAELTQWEKDTIPHAPILKWLTLTDRMEGRLRDLLARRFTHQTTRGPQPMRYAKERWTMDARCAPVFTRTRPVSRMVEPPPGVGRRPAVSIRT